jgi:signal transduction histidine kinase
VVTSIAVVVVRQWLFAIFGAYILSLFLYVAHTDGTAFQYLWPNYPGFNGMASVIIGTGVIVFGAMFAIIFLQTRRYHPIMHVVLLAMIGSVLTLDIVLWIVDPQLLKKLLVIMISVGGLIFVTTAIVAAFQRFREVQFYLYAWLAYLIPTTLFTARHIIGFELESVSLYDTVRAGMIFDAYLMGFATINQLLQSRERAMAESLALAQRNVSLGERLAVLDDRYEQLDRQARQREESVKDTVHDLRQPMHALRLSLRQMLGSDADKATDVGHVESALGYMERLVAERLADNPDTRQSGALSQARDAGSDGVTPACDGDAAEPGLHAVLRGIADMFAPEAAAKGLGLRLVLAAPDAEVAAYPLMRVVANLVSNAIKYTRQGRIVIGLRRHGAGHRVEVHDTGPGLSGAAFEQALLRSQRLDRDRTEAEGSGLGLSVVKEIANVHDWPITSCAGRRTGATIRVGILAAASNAADREILAPAKP